MDLVVWIKHIWLIDWLCICIAFCILMPPVKGLLALYCLMNEWKNEWMNELSQWITKFWPVNRFTPHNTPWHLPSFGTIPPNYQGHLMAPKKGVHNCHHSQKQLLVCRKRPAGGVKMQDNHLSAVALSRTPLKEYSAPQTHNWVSRPFTHRYITPISKKISPLVNDCWRVEMLVCKRFLIVTAASLKLYRVVQRNSAWASAAGVDTVCLISVRIIMPPPQALSDDFVWRLFDVCLTSVCLSRTSGATREQRPKKTNIGT